MKKKFISLITAFSLMFMIFNLPVDVFAANSPTSGDCGNNVTWEYNSSAKTLTISGSGAMVNYEYGGNQPWYSYHKEITTVVIQDGVTHIGNNAFWFLNNLTAVTIPKSVTTIGDNAFSSCSSLTSITFPGDVTDIGKSAFSSCNAITKIKLDSTTTVPELRDYALDGCSSNMKVVVPPEMKEDYLTAEGWWANHKDKIVPAKTTSGHCSYDGQLGSAISWTLDNDGKLTISGSGDMRNYKYDVYSPFYNDDRIKNVVISDGITRIGKYTFEGCRSLESITIPDSVNLIGYSSFGNCSSLQGITVSSNVRRIRAHAFSGCTSLSNVTLSEGALYDIGEYAFWGCSSLSSITIPNSVTTMGEFAFSSCTSLSNVKLSNKLTSISQGAFYRCNFSSVEIPQSVTSIGLNAFAKNTNLSSVTIPPNVTVLEGSAEYGGAFDDCTSLESVKFEGTTTIPTLKENAFRNCKFFTDNDESTGITLPSCEYLSAYLGTTGWETYKDYILTKHTITEVTAEDATCIETGNTKHWKCSVCGKLFSDSEGKTETTLEDVTIPAAHKLTNVSEKTATCTEAGNTEHWKCSKCGKLFTDSEGKTETTLEDVTIPAAHKLTNVSEKTATCTEAGNTEHWKCSVCGKLFNDSEGNTETVLEDVTIPAAHKLTNVSERTATCTEAGNTEHWKCSVCGKLFSDSAGTTGTTLEDVTIPAAHKLTNISEKAATCTEVGNTEHWKCSKCGKLFTDGEGKTETTLEDVAIPAAHKLTNVSEKAATCTEAGNMEHWKCSVCGKLFTDSEGKTETNKDTVAIHAKGHNLKYVSAKAATEAETGNTEYWECTECGKLFTDNTGTTATTIDKVTIPIKTHEHSFDKWESDDNEHWQVCSCGTKDTNSSHIWTETTKPATCTEEGTITKTCSVCKKFITTQIPKTDHTEEIIPAVPANCTETGLTEGKKCSVCGTILKDQTVIAALGHKWDGGTITLPPTEENDGIMLYTCTACGFTREEVLSKLNHTHTPEIAWNFDNDSHWHNCSGCSEKFDLASHSWNNGIVTVQPTEMSEGEMTYTCSVCEKTKTEPVPKLEHTHIFDTIWHNNGTSHWHECACGERSDLAAHTEDSGTVTVQPTETTAGTKTFKCSVCGYVMRTESVPATGVIPTPTPTPTPPSPPVTYPDSIVFPVIATDSDEPFIVDNSGIEGWEAISEDIHITADGGIVDIDMNGTDTLPKNIVEDIAGRDIDLILEMGGGITWTINGLTVTNAQRTNMKVYMNRSRIPANVLNTVSEELYVKELTLKHTGEFGFTPVLTVKLPDKFDDKYANLFYYNSKSNEMEFVNFGMIKDGTAKLAFTHASEYAVVVSDMPMGGEDISVAAGIFSDSDMLGKSKATYPVCVTVVLIAAGISAVIFVRRKQK